MSLSKSLSGRWRSFFAPSRNPSAEAVRTLCRLYIEESQNAQRLRQRAEKVPYPHFRAKLLRIADDESTHAGWIAEKLAELGGSLPAVPLVDTDERNSWQFFLDELETHRKCAAELAEEIHRLQPDLPGVADVLQRIYDQGANHRDELRSMLMRSDPQALRAA